MDIQVASNFERYLFYKVGGDAAKLRGLMDEFSRTGSLRVAAGADGRVDALFASASASEDEVRHTIRLYYQKHNYVLDPHTAVGVCVAEKIGTMPIGASHSPASDPIVCLATAHPAKFPAAILDAIGKDPKEAHHPRIDALMHLPTRCEVLPNSNAAVRAFMEKAIG